MLQPFSGFWGGLAKPIIGLAPMDGVTDFPCRVIMARHGRPAVIFTEFTTAQGMFHNPERVLQEFVYDEIERPIVAQIFGHRPEDFYRATLVVAALGFDGIDINMGCPAKHVVQNNCGAGLIRTPELALEIIRATRAALQDWSGGLTLAPILVRGNDSLPPPAALLPPDNPLSRTGTARSSLAHSGIPENVLEVVDRMNRHRIGRAGPEPLTDPNVQRMIPYSVKTRLGYDSVVIESWVETLLTEYPAVISIHGRTLKQMYKSKADWDAIGRAVHVATGSGTLILGNGDIASLTEAHRVVGQTGVDGVLIGRSSIGNPWIFRPGFEADYPLRIKTSLEHAQLYEATRGLRGFNSLGKHLAGYLKNFPAAKALRAQVCQARNTEQLALTLQPMLGGPSCH